MCRTSRVPHTLHVGVHITCSCALEGVHPTHRLSSAEDTNASRDIHSRAGVSKGGRQHLQRKPQAVWQPYASTPSKARTMDRETRDPGLGRAPSIGAPATPRCLAMLWEWHLVGARVWGTLLRPSRSARTRACRICRGRGTRHARSTPSTDAVRICVMMAGSPRLARTHYVRHGLHSSSARVGPGRAGPPLLTYTYM